VVNWTAAYERYAPDLLRYLRRFVRTTDRAEDLVQETFVHAMAADRIPPEIELRPWLYRIASNLAISQLRRDRRGALLWFRQPQPESILSQIEDLEHVRIALRSIPPDQAVALVLTAHHGFSRSEAATILMIPPATLKTRLARGRLNFAAAYGRIGHGLKA
jgi:RNA polymerase sigma-70 factor (ECF subfamily)